MNEQVKEALFSSLRYGLVALGTYAASKGLIGQGLVEQIVGVVMAAAAAGWGTYDSHRKVL